MEIVVPTWIVSMIVVLIGILGAFAVQRFIAFRAASVKFRSDIFKALDGIYPKTGVWKQNIAQELLATIPAVSSAHAEFAYYIAFLRKRAFRKALSAYEDQCKQEEPFNVLLLHLASPKDCPENPQTVFGRHVEKLLSFAKAT